MFGHSNNRKFIFTSFWNVRISRYCIFLAFFCHSSLLEDSRFRGQWGWIIIKIWLLPLLFLLSSLQSFLPQELIFKGICFFSLLSLAEISDKLSRFKNNGNANMQKCSLHSSFLLPLVARSIPKPLNCFHAMTSAISDAGFWNSRRTLVRHSGCIHSERRRKGPLKTADAVESESLKGW